MLKLQEVSLMPEKLDLKESVKKAITLLVQKQISRTIILSSYKINTVLKTNYGINVRVDKVGRILSQVAKRNNLPRLPTNIPKYKLDLDKTSRLEHAEQATEQFRTALTHIPSELKRREKKDQQELIHEYLSTLHLLLAEMNFLAGATLEATTHYRDALDCNTRATRNKTQIKRQVLAQERLAGVRARLGKFHTRI